MKGALVQHTPPPCSYWAQRRIDRPLLIPLFFNGFGWLPVADQVAGPWCAREEEVALALEDRGLEHKTIAHYLGRKVEAVHKKLPKLRGAA